MRGIGLFFFFFFNCTSLKGILFQPALLGCRLCFEDTAGQTAVDVSGVVESHFHLSRKRRRCMSSEGVS